MNAESKRMTKKVWKWMKPNLNRMELHSMRIIKLRSGATMLKLAYIVK